jgi:hypothetical protein
LECLKQMDFSHSGPIATPSQTPGYGSTPTSSDARDAGAQLSRGGGPATPAGTRAGCHPAGCPSLHRRPRALAAASAAADLGWALGRPRWRPPRTYNRKLQLVRVQTEQNLRSNCFQATTQGLDQLRREQRAAYRALETECQRRSISRHVVHLEGSFHRRRTA